MAMSVSRAQTVARTSYLISGIIYGFFHLVVTKILQFPGFLLTFKRVHLGDECPRIPKTNFFHVPLSTSFAHLQPCDGEVCVPYFLYHSAFLIIACTIRIFFRLFVGNAGTAKNVIAKSNSTLQSSNE